MNPTYETLIKQEISQQWQDRTHHLYVTDEIVRFLRDLNRKQFVSNTYDTKMLIHIAVNSFKTAFCDLIDAKATDYDEFIANAPKAHPVIGNTPIYQQLWQQLHQNVTADMSRVKMAEAMLQQFANTLVVNETVIIFSLYGYTKGLIAALDPETVKTKQQKDITINTLQTIQTSTIYLEELRKLHQCADLLSKGNINDTYLSHDLAVISRNLINKHLTSPSGRIEYHNNSQIRLTTIPNAYIDGVIDAALNNEQTKRYQTAISQNKMSLPKDSIERALNEILMNCDTTHDVLTYVIVATLSNFERTPRSIPSIDDPYWVLTAEAYIHGYRFAN